MAFLTPWLLAGLAFLALPVLAHLTRRDREPPVTFPSLMFLEPTPHDPVRRRRRLRHLPLLLLRCLALALVVLAFARPWRPGAVPPAAPAATGRELVILLDRSASMGAGDRWARAVAAARTAVADLAPGDRATLVAFDQSPAVLQAATADRDALARALDTARAGAGAARYTPSIALAGRILAASGSGRREVVLVSDFARNGWQADPEARLPAGVRLVTVDVGGAAAANVAVTGVELRREQVEGRDRVVPVARVARSAGAGPADVAVTLEVNGREVERRTSRLAADGAATVAFSAVALPEGWTRLVARAAAGDAYAADDRLHLAASRAQVVRVLLVEGGRAGTGASLYLRRAFAVGDRPPFRVDVRRADALGAADLAGRDVVVLHDAPPSAAAARALAEWVRRGGGLVVALGPGSAPGRWAGAAAQLLPATPGLVVDRTRDGGARIAAADRSHPAFAPFAGPRSGDLSAARIARYRAAGRADGPGVVARFDDGAPALVEHALGAGRVLVWASTFDGFWNDLALQPVFVPLVHQLATHAARHAPSPAWRTAGESMDLARAGAGTDTATRWAVETPTGRLVRVGGDGRVPVVALAEAGFYAARPAAAPEARPEVVAVNVDRAESDPARVEPADVVRHAQVDGAPAAATAAVRTAAERAEGQRAWWWLLAAALTLLAIESWLAARLSRGASAGARVQPQSPVGASRPRIPGGA